MRRGHGVMPVYECESGKYKGPQVFTVDSKLVAPDMMVLMGMGRTMFVESKNKSGFTWSRRHARFETGIDIRHYDDYLQIRKTTGIGLWVLFLQNGGAVKDAPADKPNSPRGLFGNEIMVLAQKESHRDMRHGRTGMVYWSPDYPPCNPALKLVAPYDEVVSHPAVAV
jgi:hypothetical protein